MSCNINRETISNGIRNTIEGILLRTGRFERVENGLLAEENAKVDALSIKDLLDEVSSLYGDNVISLENGIVTINPTTELIAKYAAIAEKKMAQDNVVAMMMESSDTGVSDVQRSKVRELIFNMGVKIENVNNILVNGERLTEDGIALPLQALVAYGEGKQDTLPEEAFHIAVELISQVQPGLFNKMMTTISSLPVYQQVLQQYSDNPQYQKNGKPDFIKLKKEAIAKQLVNQLEQESEVKKWWNKVVDFLRGLFQKSNVNLSPFQDSLDVIFNNRLGRVRNNLLQNKSYLVGQGIAPQTADEIIALAKSDISDDELRLRVAAITPDNAYFSLSQQAINLYDKIKNTTLTGTFVSAFNRITDKTFELFGDATSKPYRDLVNQFTASNDSNLKKEVVAILKSMVNADGTINTTATITPSFLSNDSFTTLHEQILEKLQEFPDAKMFIQQEIVSAKTNEKITPDLMIIDSKGTTHIFNFFATPEESISAVTRDILNDQLDTARRVLRQGYNVNSFGQERTFVYPMTDSKTIQVNDYDEGRYFEITSKLDSTGVAKVDNLIRGLYGRANETNDALRGQIMKAINALQVKGNLTPLITIVKSLNARSTKLFEDYSALPQKPTPEQLDYFTRETAKLLTFTDFFKNIGTVFNDAQKQNPTLFKDVIKQVAVLRKVAATLNTSQEDLALISQDIVNRAATARGIEGILEAEKAVTFGARWFSTLSEAKTRATRLLQRTWAEIVRRADVSTNNDVKRLQKIYQEYSEKFKDAKNYLQPIAQQDSKGNYIHKLIEKYDRAKFNKELALAIAGNDVAWVKNNIDYTAYQDWYNKEKSSYFKQIDETIYDYSAAENTLKQQENKDRWEARYDITKNISSTNFEVQKYISDNFISAQYQQLQQDKTALALHTFIYDLNQKAYQTGAITKQQAETLIPFVRKQTLDKIVTKSGTVSLLDNTLRGLLTTEEMEQYSNVDPETGREREGLPFYFTRDFSKDNNYKDVSQDIFKILPDYIRQIHRYELLEEKLPEMRLLQEVEASKGSIATNGWGNRLEGVENINNNDTNTEYFNNFLKATFFSHRNISNTTDTTIINTGDKVRKSINTFFGREIISEQNGKVGIYQTVDAANRLFTLKVLGLNLTVPLSNYVGGNLQALINTSKYFDKKDFIKHEFSTLSGRFSNSPAYNKAMASAEYFQFFYEGQLNERLSRKMSMNSATAYSIPERLMQLQHKSEIPLQFGIGMAMLDSMMVDGDKIVSIKEYVSEKYADRFDKSEAERSVIEATMKSEIANLKDTKAISKVMQVNGDDVSIPGLERDSQAVLDFATLVKQQVRRVTGGGNREDMRQINMTILGRSMMVFKSWMPRLISNRLQKLTWNEGLQEYEMGRWNAVGQLMTGNWVKGMQRLYDVHSMNDRGVALLKERYDSVKENYEFEHPGETFKMSKSQYFTMMQDLIHQEMREVLALGVMVGLFFGISSMQPPEDPEDKNFYNFVYKTVGKVQDELSFFYNPKQWAKIGESSVFPAVGVVKEGLTLGNEALKNIKHHITGDEKLKNKTHLFKSISKFTPILNQGTSYIGLFDAELAKELALEIKKPQ